MSAFEKFARPYFQTETRLCFRVCVVCPSGRSTMYVVRYSYLTRFIKCVFESTPGCQVNVMEKLHYELPVTSFFVEVLPF